MLAMLETLSISSVNGSKSRTRKRSCRSFTWTVTSLERCCCIVAHPFRVAPLGSMAHVQHERATRLESLPSLISRSVAGGDSQGCRRKRGFAGCDCDRAIEPADVSRTLIRLDEGCYETVARERRQHLWRQPQRRGHAVVIFSDVSAEVGGIVGVYRAHNS